MIVPLPGGQSATLRERLTYAQGRDVRAAFIEVEKDHVAFADLPLALVRAYVSSWNVLDIDGAAVPLDQPQLAPWDTIEAIGRAAIDLWRAQDVLPNLGAAPSPSSRPVRQSRVKSPT